MNKYLIICIIILILVILAIVASRVVKWTKKQLSEGLCPICIIKQHVKKSELTIKIPNEFYDNGAAVTPPMGWSSWNTFGNHINEDLILETADALVETGLAQAGYQYVNLDDCWHSSMRTQDGKLQSDFGSFPSGIKSLVEKVNAKGLKVGIYSSNGEYTCEDLPGSLGHEKTDAETFAEWGIEYFKYDYCHVKKIPSAAPLLAYLEMKTSSGLVTLTADDATLTGLAKIRKDSRLKTGTYICFLGQGKGSAEFAFNSEKEEECPLTLVIKKCGQYEKYAVIQVNSDYYEMIFPSTPAWNVDGRYQIHIRLQPGENHIKIFNPVCTRADSTYIQYKRMGEELKKAAKERKIVYSICEHGRNHPKDWAWNAGNLWRTTPDIGADMLKINFIYEVNLPLADKAGPGHWNDPDMLEVGNGNLTEDENKSHFSLWCMMSAPLILGNDIRALLQNDEKSKMILNIIKNPEMIAIDQDALGQQCIKYKENFLCDFLIKKLSGNRIAVCIYNKNEVVKTVSFSFSELPSDYAAAPQTITEIWTQKEYSGDKFDLRIPSHGCAVFIAK